MAKKSITPSRKSPGFIEAPSAGVTDVRGYGFQLLTDRGDRRVLRDRDRRLHSCDGIIALSPQRADTDNGQDTRERDMHSGGTTPCWSRFVGHGAGNSNGPVNFSGEYQLVERRCHTPYTVRIVRPRSSDVDDEVKQLTRFLIRLAD
jgi:hypothetical protein